MGKKRAGGVQCQKTRIEALERVRAVANLSPEKTNDWSYFKSAWDTKMAEIHGEEWAQLFAEMIQNVLQDLETKGNALSEFMYQETKRLFGDVRYLVLRGS